MRPLLLLRALVVLAAACHSAPAEEDDVASDATSDSGAGGEVLADAGLGGGGGTDAASGAMAGGQAPGGHAIDAATEPFTCDSMGDKNCFELQRGESHYFRRLDTFDTREFNDRGNTLVVIRLVDLVGADVTDSPTDWRYQIYGTDGYTFGGYATWTNMENGNLVLGTRKVVWELSQELPDSYRVKNGHLMVLSPEGEGG